MPLVQRTSKTEVDWLMNHISALFSSWSSPDGTDTFDEGSWSVTVEMMTNNAFTTHMATGGGKVTFTVTGPGTPAVEHPAPPWSYDATSKTYTAWVALPPGLSPAVGQVVPKMVGPDSYTVIELSG
jgi:hypothetical protein